MFSSYFSSSARSIVENSVIYIWPFQWLLLGVHRLHGASGVRVPKSSQEPWLERHCKLEQHRTSRYTVDILDIIYLSYLRRFLSRQTADNKWQWIIHYYIILYYHDLSCSRIQKPIASETFRDMGHCVQLVSGRAEKLWLGMGHPLLTTSLSLRPTVPSSTKLG